MKRMIVAAVVAGSLAAALGRTGHAASGPSKSTMTNYPASLSLADRPGDLITSDGAGPYVNGQQGVTAEFQITRTNGVVTNAQFLLTFSAVKGKRGLAERYMNFSYSQPIQTPCNPNPESNPTGTLQGTGYTVFQIGTEPINGTQLIAAQGGFDNATPLGPFRFADPVKPDPILPYECSDMFVVTRPTGSTWTLTTDTPTDRVMYLDKFEDPAYNVNPEQVGSIVQLMNGSETGSLVGNYRMPFFLTISCLSATSCPS